MANTAVRVAGIQATHDEEQLAKSGVPTSLLDIIFGSDLRDTAPSIFIRSASERLVVLSGDVGQGKSVAAALWLAEFPGRPMHGDSVPEGEVMNRMRRRASGADDRFWIGAPRLSRWARYEDDEMKKLLHPGRLVIDELGVEFADKFGNFMAVLDEVVCGRFAEKKKTLITTNLSAADFSERYGRRIPDRIAEDGVFYGFTGKSLRRA